MGIYNGFVAPETIVGPKELVLDIRYYYGTEEETK